MHDYSETYKFQLIEDRICVSVCLKLVCHGTCLVLFTGQFLLKQIPQSLEQYSWPTEALSN